MRIAAFNGSPRAENSNTHIMLDAFLHGAERAGASVDEVFLAKKNIKHCLGCFTCWTKTPGKCVHTDDMPELITKLGGADIVIFASPLYIDNVSGIMKDFMDRMVAASNPHIEMDENGEYRHVLDNNDNVPKIIAMANCGFPEQSHFQVLHLLFQRIARNIGSELIAEIYRGEGELLSVKSILVRPIVSGYKKLLQHAGEEIVTNGNLSSETKTKLDKPLISYKQYVKSANKYCDKILGQQN